MVEVDCPKGENICRIVDKAKAAATVGGGIWIATTSSKFVELHKQAAEGKLTVEDVREYIARSSFRLLPVKMYEQAGEAALNVLRSKQFRGSAQGTGIFGVVVAGGIIANEVITGIVQDKLDAKIERGYAPEKRMPSQK